MTIPVLPFTLTAVGLTFAFALLGWWIAQRVERRRRIARRATHSNQHGQPHTKTKRPTQRS